MDVGELTGDPQLVRWQADPYAPRILNGQSADFSFTTPVCLIADSHGGAFDQTFGDGVHDDTKAPDLMIRSVTWWSHNLGGMLTANPKAGGGQRIFPEKLKYNSTTVNDKVDVRVELSSVVAQNKTVNHYQFDVDDPSAAQAPVDNESTNTDNKGTTTEQKAFSIVVPQGSKSGKVTRTVSRHPGDNFRIGATIDPGITLGTDVRIAERWVGNQFQDYTSGTTADILKYKNPFVLPGDPVPDKDAKTVKSPLLTVWRTLHVERDHMGAPPSGEVFANEAMETEPPLRDVPPNGPGGTVPDPSIELMKTNYRDAYIETVDDLPNTQNVATFVHNLEEGVNFQNYIDTGNSVRNFDTSETFWVIQIFAAYEPSSLALSNDQLAGSDVGGSYLGYAPGSATGTKGPAIVFTEVVRDLVNNPPPSGMGPYVAHDTVRQRVAMHESIHRWGFTHGTYIPGSDEGIMIPAVALFGSDAQNKLNANQIAYIRLQTQPR